MPKISVIMGVYNTSNEEVLKYSIESVINQTFSDFEFIICDDGSLDKTFEILQDIEKTDQRIKLIKNKKNIGLAATLNRCLKIATGEYIARQDADDFSCLNRFERQIDFLEENEEYSFVGSCVSYFDENGEWGEYILNEFPQKEDFLFTVPIMHASVIFRKKSLILVNGYRVSKETRRAEDYDLFMRMYAIGLKAVNIQHKLYCVREDKAALKRRKYCYRIDDVIVRYKGFKKLGLFWQGIPYMIKPLVVGLIPDALLSRIKDAYYHRKSQ